MKEIKIIKYQEKYNSQVKNLLYTILRYAGLQKDCSTPTHDADLDKVGQVYRGRGQFWLALKDEKVIGMAAILEEDKETAKLKRMFVLPKYHGTGLGQKLFNTALKFAKEQGYSKIILDTHETMKRAQRFYEKNGFAKTQEENRMVFYELTL
ncbi:hypothetical protein COV53_04995 [Candidatus Gottesmanbacteria bacterium CG11_big_fil_rev_8_21_14_0_20_37_11]|uniref:N-acetyltransferase domain-containing protein n=2 Tax=Candidatus Gottesmaniibacteriota TaxID=1752720 RepID=A0A1J4TLF6_9BACT|nr:MAG: hypothetical protein AUJ73_05190 [Candidatus Gottesmanbacteria bacterium CG1_02_37_22]PIR08063.1 MAG: hypothetical protein COV53_04995 [Candidatus Gottesmanbacteria bacterium CG11_big_fil_rev_8_21_14_0_20_37_11]